jgi:hypothetical protein
VCTTASGRTICDTVEGYEIDRFRRLKVAAYARCSVCALQTLRLSIGLTYEGNWVSNEMEGKAQATFPNGHTYRSDAATLSTRMCLIFRKRMNSNRDY